MTGGGMTGRGGAEVVRGGRALRVHAGGGPSARRAHRRDLSHALRRLGAVRCLRAASGWRLLRPARPPPAGRLAGLSTAGLGLAHLTHPAGLAGQRRTGQRRTGHRPPTPAGLLLTGLGLTGLRLTGLGLTGPGLS